MSAISLQFKGTTDDQLCMTLLLALALAIAGFGVSRFVLRRWRYGLVCLGAAMFGPVLATWAFLAHPDMIGPGFWAITLGLEAAAAVSVFYATVFAYLGKGRMATLMTMRCLAILALVLVLFKPIVSTLAAPDDALPILPILVDRSASMGTIDVANGKARYEQAIQRLNEQRGRIARSFRPVFYHFAKDTEMVESLDGLAGLKPRGEDANVTNIARALREPLAYGDARDLPGVLLLTDGIHNTEDAISEAVKRLGVPVYVVGVGSDRETVAGRRNVRLVSVNAPLDAIANNVTNITVQVNMTGLADTNVEVRLLADGKTDPLATHHVRASKEVETLKAKLLWTPRMDPADGDAAEPIRKLRVVVRPEGGDGEADTNKEDNEAELHVLITQPRLRVLYVEGSIRPEYKFLRRVLSSDPDAQFLSLIRFSGSQFRSHGSLGGKRLNSLPTTDEDFKRFDVLILGDLDRTFLEEGGIDRMEKIRRFVNDGGGLLMLGGRNNFGPGGYGGTAIEAALPVVVGGRSQAQETTSFLPQLTAASDGYPIFTGITNYFPGPRGRKPKDGLQKLPPLLGCVTVVRKKQTASVLAVHPTRSNAAGPLVVLAVQQYGAGRSAAFTADTTWQWYMRMRAMGAESPYERFWAQFIRWLGNVSARRREDKDVVLLRTSSAYFKAGESPSLLALVKVRKGGSEEGIKVKCRIVPVDGSEEPKEVSMLKGERSGTFEANFPETVKPGRHRIEAIVTREAETLGTDSLTVFAAPSSPETAKLARDEKTLQQIAEQSGGQYADIAGMSELLDPLIKRGEKFAGPPPKPKRYPMFNFPLLFLFFVALLTVEWMLRRRWQLH